MTIISHLKCSHITSLVNLYQLLNAVQLLLRCTPFFQHLLLSVRIEQGFPLSEFFKLELMQRLQPFAKVLSDYTGR